MKLNLSTKLLIACLGLFFASCSSVPQKIDNKTPSAQTKVMAKTNRQGLKESHKKQSIVKFDKKKLPDELFRGTWIVGGSSAEFTIDFKNGAVIFEGYDYQDNEKFNILDTNWSKNSVRTAVKMPSTNHVLKLKLSIIDADTLKCDYSGDATGEAVWQRKP